MAASVVARFNKTALVAVSCAAVVLGLVVATPEVGRDGAVRLEAALVNLRASVATDTSALFNTASSLPAVVTALPAAVTSDAAAKTEGTATTPPAAAETGDTNALQNLVLGAIALAASPLWYLAFPVTLPLSIVAGIGISQIAAVFTVASGASPTPVLMATLGLLGAVIGLGYFAVGPFAVAFGAISSALNPVAASAANATTSPTAFETPSRTTAQSAVDIDDPTPVQVAKQPARSVGAEAHSIHPSPRSAATAPSATKSPADLPDDSAPASVSDSAPADTSKGEAITPPRSKAGSERGTNRSGAERERQSR